MNDTTCPSRFLRFGAVLAVVAAFLAFIVRESAAQTPAGRRLTLGDAARIAASQTIGVQSANFRLQEAQSRVTQQKSALLPQLDAEPNWSSRTVNSATFGFNIPPAPGQRPFLDPDGQILGPVRIWDFRANASQSIYDPVSTRRVRAARSGVYAASADVAVAAEQSASTAASIYIRAIRSDAALQARIADSTLATELLTIARDQLTAGVGVALDVTRAESQLLSARAALIVARNDRDRSRLDLLRALNLPLDSPLDLSDSLATLPLAAAENEQAAVELAVRTRPDILAATAQLDAAQLQLSVIRATRLPKVSAFGNDGEIGFINHLLNTYTYGVQVSVPIYEGGRREAQEQEQSAMAHDIEARRRDLMQQVAVDVRGAMIDMASAREQVDAARGRQRLAELEVQQARDRFRAGVAGNADVITASLTLNNARTSLVDALTSFHAARVSLARAEGTVTQLK